MPPEAKEQSEPVFEEYLEAAKLKLREVLKTIGAYSQGDQEFARKLLRVILHFKALKLGGLIFKNQQTSQVQLNIGLKENYAPAEKGFTLDFTPGEASQIMQALEPFEYLALCEEGVSASLSAFKNIAASDTNFAITYAPEIEILKQKLGEIQTSQGVPADRSKMYVAHNPQLAR